MQLTKLQLLGFKTFADKTEIEIDSGLTAIVGPNGSGKSNVVDALLWVLGEQNPRMLRGNSAQDVIFSGTDKRKPLGMAEVRLTVDNGDGALPIKFSEVTIARRIYRSGESQYLINGAPCRLKDIVELFLDTGVGKGAYSVVSQTEIDAVLSARPEDRRELFEEAAGIKKYRVKKKEALRKLEAAEGNLTRVRDILNELEEQRGPMEQQAQAARRYLLLQERLHEIEVGLLVAELQKADYELYAGRQEQEDDQAALLRLDAELARLDRVANEVRERLALTEGEMDAVRAAQQNALSLVERTDSRLALMTERGQTAQKSQERLAEELEEIAARTGQIAAAIEAARVELEETEAEEAGRREEWSAQKAALETLEAAVMEAMRQAEEQQGERMRLAEERASREAALKAARERLAEAQIRAERLTAELATLTQALTEAQARRSELEKALQEQRAQREQLAKARAEVEARQQSVQAEQVTTRAALDTARRTLAEQSARLSTLTELQESHEGFYQGVRAVLTARQKGQLNGHYRAVVDLLTVAEPYRIAIEVALGGSLQDIVTETEVEAKAGIEWLKRNRAGRATFLPLPLLRPAPGLSAREVKGLPNVEGLASDLVGFDRQYAPMAQLLLGRVLVVTDMDAALALSRKVNGWSKIVTLQGELLTPGGALTGGSLQGRGAHLVGRKGEMDDLKAALPNTRSEVERLSGQVEANGRKLQELEAERADLSRKEAAAQAEIAGTESGCAAAEREQNRLGQDRAEREAALTAVQTQIETLQAETDRLAGALESDQAANMSADDALAALTEETRALAARRDGCRARAIALEVEVSRLQEKREGLRRALAADRAALASLEQQSLQKSAQRATAQTEGAEATEERERLTAQSETARENLAKVEKELAQWRDRRQALLTESFETNNAIKETTQRRSEVTQQLHATELRLARLEVQIAQATERLQDEYGISKEEALARPEDVSIDKNTAMEVGRLRREIRGMGQVNTGAVAEYERLTERYEFLAAQRADLELGREALLATIAEIDESTRGVFMETFEAVKVEFERLFQRLFEGGSTKLILTDPEDLLETGIEVIAQPPGKKPQSLSLLSGGERALTATALLFSFLAVRPSPFVLLDEVDAPLDGVNVEKFTQLVLEFSQRSQFLIVTHNPTTMEAAPTWYGVTMREPGVSSILSYRVPQESAPSDSDSAVVLTR
ncbi:MAG TPA: chromosome segregation protein SMC [Chthonomonadaceae bacterium]|nr:chromosome segregation protein SMC [Chthonomonadaceae bacterium]